MTSKADPTTQHDSLQAALAAFQAELPSVHKGKTARVPTKNGGEYRYTYADLADVTKAAMPVLARHGLSFTTRPARTENGSYELVGVLRHASGGEDTGSLPIFGSSAQELGSGLTYARRYLLGCMTGVVTDDDDDGNVAQTAGSQRHRREDPPPEPTKEQIEAERARVRALDTADADTVAGLVTDAFGMVDRYPSREDRRGPLLALYNAAGDAGALGCRVDIPEAWGGGQGTVHDLLACAAAAEVSAHPAVEQAPAEEAPPGPSAEAPSGTPADGRIHRGKLDDDPWAEGGAGVPAPEEHASPDEPPRRGEDARAAAREQAKAARRGARS